MEDFCHLPNYLALKFYIPSVIAYLQKKGVRTKFKGQTLICNLRTKCLVNENKGGFFMFVRNGLTSEMRTSSQEFWILPWPHSSTSLRISRFLHRIRLKGPFLPCPVTAVGTS